MFWVSEHYARQSCHAFTMAAWGCLGGAKVLGNFRYWCVLLIWIKVGRRPMVLAAGAGGWIFFLSSIISLFSPLSGRRPDND